MIVHNRWFTCETRAELWSTGALRFQARTGNGTEWPFWFHWFAGSSSRTSARGNHRTKCAPTPGAPRRCGTVLNLLRASNGDTSRVLLPSILSTSRSRRFLVPKPTAKNGPLSGAKGLGSRCKLGFLGRGRSVRNVHSLRNEDNCGFPNHLTSMISFLQGIRIHHTQHGKPMNNSIAK